MPEAKYSAGPEDYARAEWLTEQPSFKDKWRYDHTAGRWHHWNGTIWAPDQTRQVNLAVANAVAHAVKMHTATKDLVKLLSITPQEKALTALSTMPGYGTNGDDWDSQPELLGAGNGIIDLRRNALVTPIPEMLVTKTTGIDFIPLVDFGEAYDRAPRFMSVMDEWMSGDSSMVSFLLLWFGSSLFGFTPEQRFLLMTGVGRNGKGALKHAIMKAVGEYSAQFDSNLYMRSKFGAARSDSARADLIALKGKRITFFSEPEGNKFNEELLKAHTGGDQIVARALYSNNIQTWDPTHSITFLVNDAPEVDDLGPSMAARVMVADFRERFDGDREDKQLYRALEREAEGVLAILCWAAKAWWNLYDSGQGGISLPERVVEQSRKFMERNDPVADALREAFIEGPEYRVLSSLAYEAYVDWHEKSDRDDDAMSQVKFSQTLERKGFKSEKKMTGRYWIGLRPMSATELAADEEPEP